VLMRRRTGEGVPRRRIVHVAAGNGAEQVLVFEQKLLVYERLPAAVATEAMRTGVPVIWAV